MATSKKHYLQSKAAQFRKENPCLHYFHSGLISSMSSYIKKHGTPEVGANVKGIYEIR